MPSLLVAFPILLALAAVLLEQHLLRRRAMGGAVLATLAAASLDLTAGGDWRSAGLAPSYLATSAALLLSAAGVTTVSGWAGWRGRWPAATALGVALVIGAIVILPLLLAGGVWRTVVALGVIAGVLLLGLLVLRIGVEPVVRRLEVWFERRQEVTGHAHRGPRPTLTLLAAHLGLTLVALSVSQLHLLLAAVVAGAVSGWMFERRIGQEGRWAVGLGVGLGGTIATWYLLATVAGDSSLAVAALPDAPFSSSFEVLAAALLMLGAWPLLHLVPFQGARQGPAAPVLGGLLLLRLGSTALPSGVSHWQPLLFLILVVAAAAAVARRNDAALMTSLGVGGIVSLAPGAGWAGLGLVVVACLLAGSQRLLLRGFRLSGIGEWLATLLPVAGVALLLPALAGMLGVEVVYSVALVVVAVGAFSGR